MNLISFFTSGSKPKTGLSPTIQGWKVDGTKVIGQVTPSAMTEIAGGFYKYDFGYGYDDKIDYIFSASGGSSLPVSERYSYATNDACRSSSIIVHGDDNWGAVGGISTADVWTYAARTLTDDTGAVDYISSQINPLHNDINWISSQVHKISSQISGISLGGGATPAQVWSYATRTLTDDTGAIDYISSQIGYVSSASEKYGYGGGAGSVAIVGGRKSPWTHKLRDDLIKNVEETKQIVEDTNKKITDYYNTEMIAIDALVYSLEELYTKVKSTTKSDTDKVLSEITYSIKVLKENRDKLKNINTINEIPNIKKDIEKISTMASMLLSDEMIEKLVLDEKKEGK